MTPPWWLNVNTHIEWLRISFKYFNPHSLESIHFIFLFNFTLVYSCLRIQILHHPIWNTFHRYSIIKTFSLVRFKLSNCEHNVNIDPFILYSSLHYTISLYHFNGFLYIILYSLNFNWSNSIHVLRFVSCSFVWIFFSSFKIQSLFNLMLSNITMLQFL